MCPARQSTGPGLLLTATEPSEAMIDVLNYTSKLEELQKLGADHVVLPYQLEIGERIARKMIVTVSALNLTSSKQLTEPLSRYNVLADSVVDRTILMNNWAATELVRIDDENASFAAQVQRIICLIKDQPVDSSQEDEINTTFAGFSQHIGSDLEKDLTQAVQLKEDLVNLKNTLDTIQAAVELDMTTLARDKKKNSDSYWNNLFPAYREEMADFVYRTGMCKEYVKHTESGIVAVGETVIHLERVKADMKRLGDTIYRGQLKIKNANGSTRPLKLYIETLRKNIESLEATQESTKVMKREKMKQHQTVVLTLPASTSLKLD